MNHEALALVFLAGGLVFLPLTSGKVVNTVLGWISDETDSSQEAKKRKDTGMVIGKCENILILIFVYSNSYTALALIFAAKTIVREKEIHKNTLYFLAGTMVNVTYSVLVGLVVTQSVSFFIPLAA